jgi:hypothetical protein
MAAPSPSTQTANAIRAINERANIPIPEIDFTVHELENGEIVRTDERVVKDVSESSGREGSITWARSNRSKRQLCIFLQMNNSGQRRTLPNPISLSSRTISTEKDD